MSDQDHTSPISPEPPLAKKKRGTASVIFAVAAFAIAWYAARDGVTYLRTPSKAATHAALVKSIDEMRPTFPKALDENTTLRDARVDDLMTIYVNEIRSGYQIANLKGLQDQVTTKVCASIMRQGLLQGQSYRYEYWSAGSDSSLLGAFNITACP